MTRTQKQLIVYTVVGGCTTAIDLCIYLLLTAIGLHSILASSLAWVGAVLFAFFSSKQFVFNSNNSGLRLFISFLLSRISTLFIGNGLLFLLQWTKLFDATQSKLLTIPIVFILNYIFAQLFVFRSKSEKKQA